MGWPHMIDASNISNHELAGMIGESIHLGPMGILIGAVVRASYSEWRLAEFAAPAQEPSAAKRVTDVDDGPAPPPSKRWKRMFGNYVVSSEIDTPSC